MLKKKVFVVTCLVIAEWIKGVLHIRDDYKQQHLTCMPMFVLEYEAREKFFVLFIHNCLGINCIGIDSAYSITGV